jgi:hypothetical protein
MPNVQIVHAFCRAGKYFKMFKLCRQNQTATKRHIQRHPAQSKSSDVIIKSFYNSDENVKKAQKCLVELQETTKQNSTVASTPRLQTRNLPPIPLIITMNVREERNVGLLSWKT